MFNFTPGTSPSEKMLKFNAVVFKTRKYVGGQVTRKPIHSIFSYILLTPCNPRLHVNPATVAAPSAPGRRNQQLGEGRAAL